MKLKPYRVEKLARQFCRRPGGHRLKRCRLVKKYVKHVARLTITLHPSMEWLGVHMVEMIDRARQSNEELAA